MSLERQWAVSEHVAQSSDYITQNKALGLSSYPFSSEPTSLVWDAACPGGGGFHSAGLCGWTTGLGIAGSTGPKAQLQVLALGSTVLKEREAALTMGARGPGSESVWLPSPRDRFPLR